MPSQEIKKRPYRTCRKIAPFSSYPDLEKLAQAIASVHDTAVQENMEFYIWRPDKHKLDRITQGKPRKHARQITLFL